MRIHIPIPATALGVLLVALSAWHNWRLSIASAVFLVQLGAVAWGSWRLAGRLAGARTMSVRLLVTSVLGHAFVVVSLQALGLLGLITLPATVGAAVLYAMAVGLAVPRTASPVSRLLPPLLPAPSRMVWSALAWACALALVGICAMAALWPKVEYDSLFYHLPFAARWIQTGRLDIWPTPFGPPNAFFPANGELFLCWVMLPFRGDVLARQAQIPSLAEMFLAAYVTARQLGVRRRPALAAPAMMLLCRHLLVESGTGMVDVMLAGHGMAAAALWVAYARSRNLHLWWIASLSLGLFLGTKYLALAYLPALALVALACLRGPIRRVVLSVALLVGPCVLTGGFFYARNWALFENPVYPVRVPIGEEVLFEGAFGKEVMEHWIFNLRNQPNLKVEVEKKLSPVMGRHWIGDVTWSAAAYAAVWLVAAMVALRRPGMRLSGGGVLLAVPLAACLYWLVMPFQEARFLFLPVGLHAVTAGLAMDASKRWTKSMVVVIVLDVLTGSKWHALVLLVGGLLAAGIGLCVRAAISGTVFRAVLPACFVGAAFAAHWLVVVGGSAERIRDRVAAGDELNSKFVRYAAAWRWLDENVRGARVAYAGTDLTYYLFGPRLENEVVYVNTDEHRDWGYFEYQRAWKRAGGADPLVPDAAFYRLTLDRQAWIENLREQRIDYLFVARVDFQIPLNTMHDEFAWPHEARWASAGGSGFERVFPAGASVESGYVQIFRVREPAKVFPRPPVIRSGEPDALRLYLGDPLAVRRDYPGAMVIIDREAILGHLVERLRKGKPGGRGPHGEQTNGVDQTD